MFSVEVMNRLSIRWAEFAGIRLIESALLLALIGLIVFVFRKWIKTEYVYWMFLLVLLKAILPGPLAVPVFTVDQSPQGISEKTSPQASIEGLSDTSELESKPGTDKKISTEAVPISSRKTPPRLSFTTWMMFSWILTVSLLLMRFVYRQRLISRLIRQATGFDPGNLPFSFESLKASAGVKMPVRMAVSENILSPAVWGIFRPVLVFAPDILEQNSAAQLHWILLHELTHIRRYDNLAILFQRITKTIFFFHPVVWIVNRIVDQQREFICDEAALSGSRILPRECGEAVLNMALRMNGAHVFSPCSSKMSVSTNDIRRRLMRILGWRQKPEKGPRYSRLAFLAGFSIIALSFSLGTKAPAAAHLFGEGINPPAEPRAVGGESGPAITIPLPGLREGAKELEMVLIKAGSFIMGTPADERSNSDQGWPAHKVTISHDFYMGKYEITQAQWEAMVGKHRSYFSGRPDNPVEKVSWFNCRTFIKKLNALGLGTFRLPTEAEWEYVCRAGTNSRFFFGDSLENADEYMWWKGNNQSSSTREVGLKKPNPWGLYDLHGNVSEWCSDRWEKPKDRGPQTDPLGPMKGFRLFPFLTNRVFRGGGFSYDTPECTSASRRYEQSIDYHYTIGFRLVLEVSDGN